MRPSSPRRHRRRCRWRAGGNSPTRASSPGYSRRRNTPRGARCARARTRAISGSACRASWPACRTVRGRPGGGVRLRGSPPLAGGRETGSGGVPGHHHVALVRIRHAGRLCGLRLPVRPAGQRALCPAHRGYLLDVRIADAARCRNASVRRSPVRRSFIRRSPDCGSISRIFDKLQFRLQHRPRSMQPRSHGSGRTLQQRRRIGIAHLFQITQRNHLAVCSGRASTALRRYSSSSELLRSERTSRSLVNRRIRLQPFLFNRQIQPRTLHHAPRQVARNPEQITAQRPFFRLISFRVSDQQHENFLRYFFGGSGIPAHMQRKPIKRSLVALIERAEGRLIPFAELPQQFLVCRGANLPWLCSALPLLLLSIARIGQIVPLFFGLIRRRPDHAFSMRRTGPLSVIWKQ